MPSIELQTQKISPKPGDVIIVTIPNDLDYESFETVRLCLESLSSKPQFNNVQIMLSYPEHQWQNMEISDLRTLRDKLNEAIYEKERAMTSKRPTPPPSEPKRDWGPNGQPTSPPPPPPPTSGKTDQNIKRNLIIGIQEEINYLQKNLSFMEDILGDVRFEYDRLVKKWNQLKPYIKDQD